MSDMATTLDRPPHPSFREALGVWARIGLLSFGGPAGQIALMHRMLVEERRWISESRFLHALNYCMLLPGPEAQQLATYIGWLLHGTRGGIVAGTLFVLPGFVVILVLSSLYALYQDTSWLEAVFFGLKAAVLAIVVEATIRVGRRALRNPIMIGLAAMAFLAIFAFAIPFPIVIAVAGLVGYVGARSRPDLFAGGGHKGGAFPDLPSVIDTDSGQVDPTWQRAGTVLSSCLALWVAPFVVLVPLLGWDSVFVPIGAFFSQMALVTFGGAYAVLAYVATEAVSGFGWLQPGEMLDGLALAETTPGPLVLVLSFVGFLAGFRQPGLLDPLAAGLLGATLTTWVSFVPCFLWIFLGAPYIERLRSNRALAGALGAITGAVVGVILNLAVWFGLHVMFRSVGTVEAGPLRLPWPHLPSFDPVATALCVLAAVMLFRFRLGIVRTLIACALLGAAAGLAGLT
jgi:chromate transporter